MNGVVVIENKYDLKHEGIFISLEGFVDIRFNLRSINFMDTFQGANKSMALVDATYELARPGRLAPGVIEFP